MKSTVIRLACTWAVVWITGTVLVPAAWADQPTPNVSPESASEPKPVTKEDFWDFVKALPPWRPPEWQASWFPHEPQVGFEEMEGWKVVTYGGLEADCTVSRQRPLHGKSACRISYWDPTGKGALKLTPPNPIPITEAFDTVQMWVYGNSYEAGKWTGVPRPTVVVRDSAGDVHRIEMGSVGWIYWSISRAVVAEVLPGPSELLAIEFRDMPTGPREMKQIYLDCLSFHEASRDPLEIPELGNLPFPTRVQTILPSLSDPGTTSLRKTDKSWIFRYRGGDTDLIYTYEPLTGTLSDLAVRSTGEDTLFRFANGGGVAVVLGGKMHLPGSSELKVTLEEDIRQDDRVMTRWKFEGLGDSVTITYSIWLWGKSLVVDVISGEGKVSDFFAGDPDLDGINDLWVPYLTYNTEEPGPSTVFYTDGIFFSRCWDWYHADATSLADAGRANYQALTDGTRNPLHERLFYTVSTDFHEVLPNIANPPNPYGKRLGGQLYTTVIPAPDRVPELLPKWQRLKRYGLDHVLVKHHTEAWSHSLARGMQPGFSAEHASEDFPGGDEGLARYIAAVRSLGYDFALYTNYTGIQPVSRHWNERHLTRDRDRGWRHYWVQAYCVSPIMTPVLAGRVAPIVKHRFGNNASYYDGSTANRAWNYVDFDARKRGAGKYGTVIRGVAKAMRIESEVYGGPVMGEGLQHFFAGLNAGNYAALRTPMKPREAAPYLVDFDLLKLHPLQSNLGMGFNSRENYHHYVCGSLAHGRSPWIGGNLYRGDPTAAGVGPIWYYFMTQQAAAHYAMEPVRTIAYFDGEKLQDSSTAVRRKIYQRNQVFVEYENAMRLFANGHAEENWKVAGADTDYVLPPFGWLIDMPGTLLEYSALRDGRRVDFVDAPEHLYVNAFGTKTDFGPIVASGGVNVRKIDRDEIEVIPFETGQEVTIPMTRLPGSGLDCEVSILDFERTVLRRRTVGPGTNHVTMNFGLGEFSARIVGGGE